MSPEKIELATQHSHRVRIPRHRNKPVHLRLNPSHSVQIQNFNIVETLFTVVASKHIQLAADSRHSVAGAGTWFLTAYLWFRPNETHCVEHVQVVKPLIAVMAAVKVNFITVHCCSMIIATGGFGSKSFRLRPTH